MSDNQDEWPTDNDVSQPDDGADSGTGGRRRRVNYLGWLLSLSGIAWLIFFVIFVARSIGWSLVPQLLPYEIGGMVAGLLVPPAVLFALASLTSRRQRLADMLTALEGQVARLEAPFSHANSELSELGEMLVLYGRALEESVNDARAHLQELRGGFGQEAAELEAITATLRALMVQTNEAAGDQADQLAQMTAQVGASLAEIREIGHGEAGLIDDASRRAAEVVRELVTTLGDQIEAIEAGFHEAVSNTVDRVAGARDTAAGEIRGITEQVLGRTQEAVDAVTQQVGNASIAISDAGSQAAEAIEQASEAALARSRALGEDLEQRAADAG